MRILGIALCSLAIDYAEDNSPAGWVRALYCLYPPVSVWVATQVHDSFFRGSTVAPSGTFSHVKIFETMRTFHTFSFPPVGIGVPLGFGVDG